MAYETPTLQDLTKQMQGMQEQLALAKAELAETELTGTAGGGLVTVTMTGEGEVTGVVIDQAAVDEGDAESLATLTLTAIREAVEATKSLAMEKITTAAASLRAGLGAEEGTY